MSFYHKLHRLGLGQKLTGNATLERDANGLRCMLETWEITCMSFCHKICCISHMLPLLISMVKLEDCRATIKGRDTALTAAMCLLDVCLIMLAFNR